MLSAPGEIVFGFSSRVLRYISAVMIMWAVLKGEKCPGGH